MQVENPNFKVIYEGQDITEDISRSLTLLSYTDHVTGETDEIEIKLDDSDGLWRSSWFPKKGDQISVEIGSSPVLNCGVFEIDEIELMGPPDTVTIRGIGAGVKRAVRTKQTVAYEKQTVQKIVQTVADRNGFSVVMSEPEKFSIVVPRVTQNRESDLSFLNRLAASWGAAFSLREETITFEKKTTIEDKSPIKTLTRKDLTKYSFKDKTFETYAKAKLGVHDPGASETVESSAEATDTDSEDTLVIQDSASSQPEADAKTEAALSDKNNKSTEANVTVYGDTDLLSGVNFDLTGMGEISGTYHIETSVHKIDRSSGYTTQMEIKRLAKFTDPSKK